MKLQNKQVLQLLLFPKLLSQLTETVGNLEMIVITIPITEHGKMFFLLKMRMLIYGFIQLYPTIQILKMLIGKTLIKTLGVITMAEDSLNIERLF